MFKKHYFYFLLVTLLIWSCGDDDNSQDEFNASLDEAIETYASIVAANYEDALNDAQTMKIAIDALVANPSQNTLTAAKNAWLKARETYGQTEAFRFYGGPIDNDEGPEGQLNAWPLDESYIDYVNTSSNGDDPASGKNIINNPSEFPTIDKNVIASLNEQGGETNVSSGYHAIEFLLWGQDESTGAGGGERPYTDYVTGDMGTNENQERRAQYIQATAELIIDDLQSLVDEWMPNGSYRNTFVSDAELQNSLEKIVTGIGKLSKGELAGERMFVAWDLRSKEDEHSCFSDNTHRDIVTNAQGIRNVYLGTYKRTNGSTVTGTSIHDLLMLKDAALAAELENMVNSNVTAAEAIQAPFDQEFLAEPGRTRIQNSFTGLRLQGDKLAEAAQAFGFSFDPSDI